MALSVVLSMSYTRKAEGTNSWNFHFKSSAEKLQSVCQQFTWRYQRGVLLGADVKMRSCRYWCQVSLFQNRIEKFNNAKKCIICFLQSSIPIIHKKSTRHLTVISKTVFPKNKLVLYLLWTIMCLQLTKRARQVFKKFGD